ncbi:hypothetical protein N8371_04080 [Vicingaceae bacterium]|nr:hypothetical protein [Vicingaceae bacterium]MDB4062197.1 hypothetical protein [Vicingaceae bacterium]MDC1451574.1 hypothetical protein [Vicingaceae bacterium]
MKKCVVLFFLIALGLPKLHAQKDYTWWNEQHNWDGFRHWTSYMKLTSKYMGPNALPVSDSKKGTLPTQTQLKLAGEGHFSDGDNTQNLFSSFYLPLFTNRVGFQLEMVPVEFYKMDDKTRDERISRELLSEGHTVGDLYIATFIQLTKNHEKLPDMVLGVNFRTASGANLDEARFTNTPGYFFDFSASKVITYNEDFIQSIRPHALAGFYVYQTYLENNYQNDAFMFGLGIDVNSKKLTYEASLNGYVGYLNAGDRPMVARIGVRSNDPDKTNFGLRIQQGIIDQQYTTARVYCILKLKKWKIPE